MSTPTGGHGRWTRPWDVVCVAAIAVLPWVLYRAALSFWWADDCLEMLRYLREHPRLDYLWNPPAWQALPGSVLTPLQFLSLHLDLAAFGMTPRAFYAHQLATVSLCGIALFAALRDWWGRGLALAVTCLFLLGRPVLSLAAMVPARHYLEAITFGALAAWCFRWAVLRSSRGAAWLAAGLALTAMLFKETAVPLPLALAALPVGTWQERRRACLAQAVALVLYAAYRLTMLGPEMLRGYGFMLLPADLPRHLLALPGRAVLLFAGPWPWTWVGLGCLAVALLVLVVLRSRALPAFAWASALALGPIVPVSTDLGERYVATLWLVAALGVGVAARAALSRGNAWRHACLAGLAVTLAVFTWLGRAEWRETVALARQSDAESRAMLALGDGDVLRRPVAMPAFLGELQRYRSEVLKQPGRPSWFEDDLALCEDRFAGLRLWQFDAAQGEVVEVSARRTEIRREACAAIRPEAPLRVTLRLGAEGLFWQLGDGAGRYTLVFDGGVRAVAVPSRGGFHLPRPSQMRLRVRYDDSAGWRTYSPELELAGNPGETIAWKRPRS